jgi:hypothetical protein
VLQRESEQLHGLLQRLREHLKGVQDRAFELVAALSFATVFVSGVFSIDGLLPFPRRALAAVIAMWGAQPGNGVGTSCKPLAVIKGVGGPRVTEAVTKKESTGRGVTRGGTAVTRAVTAVTAVTASATAQ